MQNFDLKSIRQDDLDTIPMEGQDYIMFDVPRNFIFFRIPALINGTGFIDDKNYHDDKRYPFMMSLISNFAYLNPNFTDSQIWMIAKILNYKCEEPINDEFLKSMVEDVKQLVEIGELFITPNKTRNYILNKNLSPYKMSQLKGQLNGRIKRRNTLEKLRNILNCWQYGKFSVQKFANISGYSIGTVKNYINQLKTEIDAVKNIKPKPKENETFIELRRILINWRVKKDGKAPTNKILAELLGLTEDAVKKYSPRLKRLKRHIKEKFNRKDTEHQYFAPFDDENYQYPQSDEEYYEQISNYCNSNSGYLKELHNVL